MKGKSKLSGKELPKLQAARTAERKRLQWKAGGVFGGATTAFIFALWTLWALIFGAGALWAVSGLALAAPFVLLALGGFARSKSQSEEVDKALREAWKIAARDIIIAHPGGMTASQLAEQLPLTEQQAEQIATELSVDNVVSSRVTEDGRLLLQAVAPRGARIDESVTANEPVADPLEQRFAELEQAQQEADAQQQQQLMKK